MVEHHPFKVRSFEFKSRRPHVLRRACPMGGLVVFRQMQTPGSARSRCLAPVAVHAANDTLPDLCSETCRAPAGSDEACDILALRSSHVIELQDHGIRLAAVDAGMLEQVGELELAHQARVPDVVLPDLTQVLRTAPAVVRLRGDAIALATGVLLAIRTRPLQVELPQRLNLLADHAALQRLGHRPSRVSCSTLR